MLFIGLNTIIVGFIFISKTNQANRTIIQQTVAKGVILQAQKTDALRFLCFFAFNKPGHSEIIIKVILKKKKNEDKLITCATLYSSNF